LPDRTREDSLLRLFDLAPGLRGAFGVAMVLAEVHLVEWAIEATLCRFVASRVADPLDALAKDALERVGLVNRRWRRRRNLHS
jgi:hypothetical protein